MSRSTVPHIRDAHGLQPHRIAMCKLSKDPACVEQLTDVVGLDLNPPDQAVVLCGDEKSRMQALDRTQPDRRGTLTHDSQRQGPTMLCSEWHVLTGEVLGPDHGRPRQQEFLQFLRHLDRAFPRDRTLHGILDNYATHPHKTARQRLASHPRFKLHCPPTGASWLNLGESWCSQLPRQRLRRGVFCSGQELVGASQDYLTHHHADPQPFVGSTPVDAILAKASKCKVILGLPLVRDSGAPTAQFAILALNPRGLRLQNQAAPRVEANAPQCERPTASSQRSENLVHEGVPDHQPQHIAVRHRLLLPAAGLHFALLSGDDEQRDAHRVADKPGCPISPSFRRSLLPSSFPLAAGPVF